MKLLSRVSQDAAVSAWLRAEIDSSRFAASISSSLARHGIPRSMITDPDLESSLQNACRLNILAGYRGFGRPAIDGAEWLAGRNVGELDWWRVELSRSELAGVRFTDGGFWTEESEGTRLPGVHVRRLLADKERPEDDLPNLVHAAVLAGIELPPMIVIDAGPGTRLVVLEGHVRLIAYVMAGSAAPDRVIAILGRSPSVATWPEY
ncbi:MAG TPA: hypothetical protein VHC49_01210 [Mycobacteriales bacterium]|nr:hypothetical protein [Mycobacteriales bacterium]